jgi:hypothetical protein
VGVSYELLLEEDTAMEAFLVCNATLRLQADAYSDCAATFAGFKTVHAKIKATQSLRSHTKTVRLFVPSGWRCFLSVRVLVLLIRRIATRLRLYSR